MSQISLSRIGSTSAFNATADSGASPDTVMYRDSNGDSAAKNFEATVSLKTSGGLLIKPTAKSANFSADALTSGTASSAYVVDTTSGNVTVSLPAVASSSGVRFTFKKTVAANSLILDGNASETIDGATTKTASAQYAAITIFCDGSVWHIESTIGSWT